MFLGVSGTVRHMDMTDVERANFATWLRGIQRRKFADNAKAAYTYAGVNSATWTRALREESLKPRSIAKIVRAFRPESEGDWRALSFDQSPPPAVSASTQDEPGYVSGPGPKADGGDSEDRVLRAIEEMRQDVQAMEQRLSERLERLEGGS